MVILKLRTVLLEARSKFNFCDCNFKVICQLLFLVCLQNYSKEILIYLFEVWTIDSSLKRSPHSLDFENSQ